MNFLDVASVMKWIIYGCGHWRSTFRRSVSVQNFATINMLCFAFMNVLRFHMIPIRLVVEGGFASLYGMV